MTIPNTFSAGTKAESAKVNANFSYVNPMVHQIYTGSGFDAAQSGGAGTDEQSEEMTAITAAELVNKQYVKITYTYQVHGGTGIGTANAYYKIEEKYTGGAYGDALAYTKFMGMGASNEETSSKTFIYYYTLNANDLANGCQFKLWGKVDTDITSANIQLINIQTIVEVIGG